MKNNFTKWWLGIGALALSVGRADDFKLETRTNPSQICIPLTSRTNVYALLGKRDFNSDWSSVASSRGTESNLVFDVNNMVNSGTNFYKATAVYTPTEPALPISQPFHFTHGTTSGPQSFPLAINLDNYLTNNMSVLVTISVPDNPYNVSYTSNMPMTNRIAPGQNSICTTTTLNCGYGAALWGTINVEEN